MSDACITSLKIPLPLDVFLKDQVQLHIEHCSLVILFTSLGFAQLTLCFSFTTGTSIFVTLTVP